MQLAYLKELEPILMVLLGWLFGLFTSPIAERIRRYYRRKDLMAALIDEMLGLQNVMANVGYRIHARYAEVSDEILDKLIPIVEGYRGMDRDEKAVAALKGLRKIPEEQRIASYQASNQMTAAPNVGLAMKEYSIPLFAAQVSDLAICSIDFQRRVLHIRYHLDLYNQNVRSAQLLMEKSFDDPTPNDWNALIENRETAYRDTCRRAEIIVEAISDLYQKYAAQ